MTTNLKLPALTQEDAKPAKILEIQLTSRVATQPLHYQSGDEETALESVHNLFGTTRDLLTQHPRAAAFEITALFLLNSIVRPHTARWHRWLVDGRFADERGRRQFRYELKQLQPRLLEFANLLHLMVQGPQQSNSVQHLFARIVGLTPDPNRFASLGGAVAAGIGPEVELKTGPLHKDLQFCRDLPSRNESVSGGQNPGSGSQSISVHVATEDFATAEEINLAERRFIHRRRQLLGCEPSGDVGKPVENATGLCLSGGGIRSATFCLGIVQVFAKQGMLTQFDYLSTVSGGGYLGTFLTSFLGTPQKGTANSSAAQPEKDIFTAIKAAFDPERGREAAAVRHLRNNSRYLISGGLWGRFKIVGLLVTGVLTNILLVLPIPFLAALAVFAAKQLGYWDLRWPGNSAFIGKSAAQISCLTVLYCVTAAWFCLPLIRNLARGAKPAAFSVKFRNVWEAAAILLGIVTLVAGTLVTIPNVFTGLGSIGRRFELLWPSLKKTISSPTILTTILTAVPIIFGLLTARLKSGLRKKAAGVLFALSGPLLYIVAFSVAGIRLFDGEWSWLAVAIPTFAVAIWGWLFVDINEFSPHRYYRAKLCQCYLAVRGEDQTGALRNAKEWLLHGSARSKKARETGVGTRRQLPLSEMNRTMAAPYHIINTAANLPSSHEPNLRGRDCDFYSFSQAYCGGPVCGFFKTETLERLDSHVDLGSAMAISGAAAASNMGVRTQRQYRFLLTLLNVRLGYWLRNPVYGLRRALNGPGPFYLFREMFGWMHENTRYLNLSDGGHIENLALYELLRRRCKFIVVVDGGMEPGMECADLMLAQRYAQIDLGVQFNLDIADLALDANRRSRAYAVFGKIRYSPRQGESSEDIGWLVYIKLACTGGEPGYVVDYRRQNPDFPHQTTADQIYDEAQFEAYRRLGECAAESLFRPELSGADINPLNEKPFGEVRFDTLWDWFQALANNLLPDNDMAFDEASPDDMGKNPT